MKLITVGTGSTGNCYLLQKDDGHYIALDCGCPWKQVMVGCGFRPSDIDLALVTHSHKDHSRYAKDFEMSGIDVYGPEIFLQHPRQTIRIKDVAFTGFDLPHDVPCFGYLIQVDGHKIIYMTDFEYCRYTFKSSRVDTWIIACNHVEAPNEDEEKYAHVVLGHSSLDTVRGILAANKTDAMKNVVIVHYSADADTNEILAGVKDVVGDSVNVHLAQKGKAINIDKTE